MSKKLTNNGMWEASRMMLPEHREQLHHSRRHAEASQQPAQMTTSADLALIRDWILLTIMIEIVENNYAQIKKSSYSMRVLYERATEALLLKMNADELALKRSLQQHLIHIYDKQRNEVAVEIYFTCRKYEDVLRLSRDLVRAEINQRIKRYIHSLFEGGQQVQQV